MTPDLTRPSEKVGGPSASSRTYGNWRGVINLALYLVVVPSAYNLALAIKEAPAVNWLYWYYAYAFGFPSWVWALVLIPVLFGVDRATRSLTARQTRWCIAGTAALLNTAFGEYVLRTPLTAIVLGVSGLLYGLLFLIRQRPS